MEITCTRCHEVVRDDNVTAPPAVCRKWFTPGRPSKDRRSPRGGTSRCGMQAAWIGSRPESGPDAGCSGRAVLQRLIATQFSGIFWMASAAGWAVVLYMRSQRPAWITIGPARASAWLRTSGGWLRLASGGALFVERVVFHQSSQIDGCIRPLSWILSSKSPAVDGGLSPTDAR